MQGVYLPRLQRAARSGPLNLAAAPANAKKRHTDLVRSKIRFGSVRRELQQTWPGCRRRHARLPEGQGPPGQCWAAGGRGVAGAAWASPRQPAHAAHAPSRNVEKSLQNLEIANPWSCLCEEGVFSDIFLYPPPARRYGENQKGVQAGRGPSRALSKPPRAVPCNVVTARPMTSRIAGHLRAAVVRRRPPPSERAVDRNPSRPAPDLLRLLTRCPNTSSET
ncbi:unnamed protein product, partial [Iphiclides podalirius]